MLDNVALAEARRRRELIRETMRRSRPRKVVTAPKTSLSLAAGAAVGAFWGVPGLIALGVVAAVFAIGGAVRRRRALPRVRFENMEVRPWNTAPISR